MSSNNRNSNDRNKENNYHGDSSACIVVDGKLIATAEEERFIRIKHWAGLPN
jgi:carbamoyltransferase